MQSDASHNTQEAPAAHASDHSSLKLQINEALSSLQTQVAELHSFLILHVGEVLTLKDHLDSHREHNDSQMLLMPLRTTGTSEQIPIQASLDVEPHLQRIRSFVDAHISNLRALQLSLSISKTIDSNSSIRSPRSINEKSDAEPSDRQDILSPFGSYPEVTMVEAEKYKLLSQQFSNLVFMSTFTASVIIAFLSLMHDIHGDVNGEQAPIFGRAGTYQSGVILGFLAFSGNLGVAVLAGANAAVSSYAAASPSGRRRLLRSRAHRLMFCGYVQLLSGLSFAVGILLLLNLVLGRVVASLSFVICVLGVIIACWDLAFQRPPSPRLIYETFFPPAPA